MACIGRAIRMERAQRADARVAFLFLTIQGLSREEMWRQFFQDADPAKYRIYCHPKYPDRVPKSSVVYPHIISSHVKTHWASISLVKATILLLQAAVQDSATQRFILVSETCIPIVSFDQVYNAVMGQPMTSFCYNPLYATESTDIHGRYKRFKNKKMIPLQSFMKAHQWWIMDRGAAMLCSEGRHINEFERVFASDEHYFINICKYYNMPFQNQQRTFVEFEYERSHPRVFHEISLSFLENLRQRGYLFMRKIRPPTIFIP